MIKNNLTYQELESIMCPILKLEKWDVIIETVQTTFHIPNYFSTFPTYRNPEYMGIKVLYKGFEINVEESGDYLNNDLFNFDNGMNDVGEMLDGRTISIFFTRKKNTYDKNNLNPIFNLNPTRYIVKDLIKICCSSIYGLKFRNIHLGRTN